MSIISQTLLVFFFGSFTFLSLSLSLLLLFFLGEGGGRRPPFSLVILERQEAVQLTEDFSGIPRPCRTLWKYELTSKAKGVDSETASA